MAPQSRNVAERRYRILDLIAENSKRGQDMTFEMLTRMLNVQNAAKPTLSQDLRALIAMRVVEKKGPALYALRSSLTDSAFVGTAYDTQRKRFQREKQAVARACVDYKRADGRYLIGDQFCLITHGSSTAEIFRYLRTCPAEKLPKSVITNSCEGLLELMGLKGPQLIVLAGTRELDTGGFIPSAGAATADMTWLSTLKFSVLVISCSALDERGGVWCDDSMHEFRSQLIEHANEKNIMTIVIADYRKLTNAGGHRVGEKTRLKMENTWLFVSLPADKTERDHLEDTNIYRKFKKDLAERLQPVVVPNEDADTE